MTRPYRTASLSVSLLVTPESIGLLVIPSRDRLIPLFRKQLAEYGREDLRTAPAPKACPICVRPLNRLRKWTMKSIFQSVKPKKVTAEIVHQMTRLIKEGKLQPGEKLPGERTLAGLLGVGRSTLREAVNILETLGFLETRNRKGIFVKSVSSPIISDPLSKILEEDKSALADLYGLRKDIELASADLAARLHSVEDLEAMEEHLARMKKDADDTRIVLKDDMGFHLAIAHATHNFLRAHILKSLFDLSSEYFVFVRETIAVKSNIPMIFGQHEQIYQAIKSRDPEAARSTMDQHLTWVQKEWEELIRSKT